MCSHCIILGVEKKTTAQLQDPRSVKKLMQVDENITFCFAGFNADARKLVDIVAVRWWSHIQARVEAQSYRMSYDEVPSVKYIANYVGRQQQKWGCAFRGDP